MNNLATTNKQSRNSFIEVIRLLLALAVLVGHDFTPDTGRGIAGSDTAVEGFFIISGWFLIDSFIKSCNFTAPFGYWRSNGFYLKTGFKKLAIPVIPCYVCILISSFFSGESAWGRLFGYVHTLMLCSIIFFLIYYFTLVKNRPFTHKQISQQSKTNTFYIVIASIFLIFTVTRFVGTQYEYNIPGIIRGLSAMSLGILGSQIPKIVGKKKNAIIIPLFILSICAVVLINIWPMERNTKDIYQFIFFPIFMYFATQINFSCKPLNYCGKFSADLYYFQSLSILGQAIAVYTSVELFSNRVGLMLGSIIPALLFLLGQEIYFYFKNKKGKTVLLTLPDTEHYTSVLEKNKKIKGTLFSSYFIFVLGMVVVLLTSVIMFLTKQPGWQNLGFIVDGKGTDFSRIMTIVGAGFAFASVCFLGCIFNISYRKKYIKIKPQTKFAFKFGR